MIEFQLSTNFLMSPKKFCDEIFDVSNWPDFEGYGPVPRIEIVRRKNFSESRIGTRFEVTSTDGSRHVEIVAEYVHGELLVLQFEEFSKPLADFATHIVETFRFSRQGNITNLERSFQLFPKNFAGKILLSVISIFLRQAVKKHMEKLGKLDKEPIR
jgi:hypothetical protein